MGWDGPIGSLNEVEWVPGAPIEGSNDLGNEPTVAAFSSGPSDDCVLAGAWRRASQHSCRGRLGVAAPSALFAQ